MMKSTLTIYLKGKVYNEFLMPVMGMKNEN